MQTRNEKSFGAPLGVAVRALHTEAGPADYAPIIERQLRRVVEANSAGTTLSGLANHASRHLAGAPWAVVRRLERVRFEYVSSGNRTLSRDHAGPNPASCRVLSLQWPETLER